MADRPTPDLFAVPDHDGVSFLRHLARNPFYTLCAIAIGTVLTWGVEPWGWRLAALPAFILTGYRLGRARTPVAVKLLGAMATIGRPASSVELAIVARVGPSELYHNLRKLEETGLAVSHWEHTGAADHPRRRLYQLPGPT